MAPALLNDPSRQTVSSTIDEDAANMLVREFNVLIGSTKLMGHLWSSGFVELAYIVTTNNTALFNNL